jgi:hypothetical protein
MSLEGDKIRQLQAECPPHKRIFRINAGMGWTGKMLRRDSNLLVIKDPRPLYAAPAGWPDLCGWEEIEITPEMVGTKIAQFIGEEIKLTGRLSREQLRFKDVLERMGGSFTIHGRDE